MDTGFRDEVSSLVFLAFLRKLQYRTYFSFVFDRRGEKAQSEAISEKNLCSCYTVQYPFSPLRLRASAVD
jgi:hypothetical protein